MTQSEDGVVKSRGPRVRAFLFRESIAWVGALLAVTGLAGLLNAVIQPINQLTKPVAEVLVNSADGRGAEFSTVDLPVWLNLLSETKSVAGSAALCAGAWMLRKVLLSIGAGQPFDPRNPRRLRWLALAVFVGTIIAPVATYWSARVVLGHVGADPLTAYLPLELWGPLLALVILAAAEAFRQGRQLADETAGLV